MTLNDYESDDYVDDDSDADDAYNAPTIYVDGEQVDHFEDVERVQIEFDTTVNGMQTEAQEHAPLGWCNSAAVTLDRDDDAVHVSISVGDPRGAFAFTVRRLSEGNSVSADGSPVLIMHVPYPGESTPHMSLSELHPGTYRIGD